MSDTLTMVETIERAVREDDFHLSEWEDGFVESVGDLARSGLPLSDKQDACLEKIWKRITG